MVHLAAQRQYGDVGIGVDSLYGAVVVTGIDQRFRGGGCRACGNGPEWRQCIDCRFSAEPTQMAREGAGNRMPVDSQGNESR